MEDRIKEIEKMMKADPSDRFLNYALAIEYEKIGDKSKAVEILENLLSKAPDYLGGYYKLGQLYEQKDQPDKAITIYKKGIELAKTQNDQKTLSELNEALWLICDDEDY
ncbi:MAG: hypothetical protein Kow0079_12790 [Vicingaceae bacterium]